MDSLLRRWRILTLAERLIGVLRVCIVLRAALPLVRTALMIRRRKGR